MSILLLGASGQVGYEFAALSRAAGLVTTTRSGEPPVPGVPCHPLDIADVDAVAALIGTVRPRIVINASAYTAVDRAEAEPGLAFRINAEAPIAMAEACASIGARLLHFSTDYVFDGQGGRPYRSDDPASPLGVYGASKRAGEEGVLASGADALVVRTAWVYATRAQNFLMTMLKLARERDELRIVDDQVGTPTPAWLVAAASKALLENPKARGLHHVVAGGSTTWFGFAQAIFDAATRRGILGRVPRLVPIATSDYPTAARRPAYSVLDSHELPAYGITVPQWREALEATLDRDLAAAGRSLR